MASGTPIRPERGAYEFTGATGRGCMPYGHDQVATKDSGHHRPLHALHLETKLLKLGQHILAFHDAQVGKEGRPDRCAAAQRIPKGIEVAQRVPIPDELIPADAAVEMDAKKASGYYAESLPDAAELALPKGRALRR